MEGNYTIPFVSVSQIVNSYLNEKNWEVDTNYKRFVQIVTEYLVDNNIFNAGVAPRRFVGQVNSNNILDLPADYIDYAHMGIVKNGVLYPIIPDDTIFIDPALVNLEPPVPANFQTPQITPTGTWFTIGGGHTPVKFKVYKEDRIIVFKGYLVNQFVGMEYITTGIKIDSETIVPIELQTVVKNWLNYLLKERDDNVADVKVMRAKSLYNASFRRWKRLQNKMTPAELISIIRSGYSMGPKP